MICLMFYKEFQCMTKFTTNLKKKLKKKLNKQIHIKKKKVFLGYRGDLYHIARQKVS